MTRIISRILIVVFFATRVAAVATGESPEAMKGVLESIRERHHLPALAAIAMIDGKTQSMAATGVRKEGSPVEVTVDDLWHIGSDTKSMTATLAAMFVEQGRLKWDTTVGEVFPILRERMEPQWRDVTMEQLLTHRSGAPHDAPGDLWAAARKRQGPPREQRLAFIRGLVMRPPEAPPGSKFIYSNQGYAIAGAMLEKIADKPWEELMRTMLFNPLGMTSAGFGAPASPGKIDQPWGHAGEGTDRKPVAPGPDADNPPAIGPAGTVHCSLTDLARYAAMHAQGERMGSSILKPAGFEKLHTPSLGGDYAFGWGVSKRGWAGGTTLSHAGSNTMFYVIIWIAPAKNAVFIAATNAAGREAETGTDDAVAALIQRLLPKEPGASAQ